METTKYHRQGHVSVPLMEERGAERGDKGGHTEKGYSFVQLIFGVVMLVIGLKYQPGSAAGYITDDSDPDNPVVQERDPCPNGAANYLFIAGICILVASLVNIISKASQYIAEQDGKISGCEKCGLCIFRTASGIMAAVDFAMLIWGSVIVFGAWSSWTDDYQLYSANPDSYNYCQYEPMMFAFCILIIKWVLVPLIFLLVCCCGTLCACCFFNATD